MWEKWLRNGGGIKKSSVMENVLCKTSIFFQFITLLALQKSNIVICAINKAGRCAFPESLTWQISALLTCPHSSSYTWNFCLHNFWSRIIFSWIFMSSTLTFTPTEDLELPSWPRSSCQRPLGGSRTAWNKLGQTNLWPSCSDRTSCASISTARTRQFTRRFRFSGGEADSFGLCYFRQPPPTLCDKARALGAAARHNKPSYICQQLRMMRPESSRYVGLNRRIYAFFTKSEKVKLRVDGDGKQ